MALRPDLPDSTGTKQRQHTRNDQDREQADADHPIENRRIPDGDHSLESHLSQRSGSLASKMTRKLASQSRASDDKADDHRDDSDHRPAVTGRHRGYSTSSQVDKTVTSTGATMPRSEQPCSEPKKRSPS